VKTDRRITGNDKRRTMSRRAAASSRGYESALVKGTAPAAKYASHAEVARRYRDGVERSFAEKDDLRRMLLRIGVDVAFVPRYLSFAVRLARICRNYEMATRENLVRGLIREWETRLSFSGVTPSQPDREVLLRICELGFGVKLGQWVRESPSRPKSDVRCEMSEGRSGGVEKAGSGEANRQGRQGQESEESEGRVQKSEAAEGG
jgi:hypothetical protein